MVVGLITNDNEAAYREEVRDLALLPQRQQDKGDDRGLQEMEGRARPIHINGAVMELVKRFKFLSVQIIKELTLSTHIDTVVKRA